MISWPFSRKSKRVDDAAIVGAYAHDRMMSGFFSRIDPNLLKSVMESSSTGEFREMEALYRSMKMYWPRFAKNIREISGAVARLDWEIMPYSEKGSEPKRSAQKEAALVEKALWADAPNTAKREQGLKSMMKSFSEVPFRGHGVSEILWKSDGGIVFPRAYYPVSSVFYKFTTGMNERDKLVLRPDGTFSSGEIDFPENKFLVGLDVDSFDHPMFNARFFALIGWFGAVKSGLGWFMAYCQLYGQPRSIVRASDKKARENAVKALKRMASDGILGLSDDVAVEFIDKMKSGSAIPHKDLIEMADLACDNLILGQTLTSSTEGSGSRALGEVHDGIRADMIRDVADFVADLINNQLIPYILKLNFGQISVNRPYIGYKMTSDKHNMDKINFLKGLKDIGVEVTEEYGYSLVNVPRPNEGDRILGKYELDDDLAGIHASRVELPWKKKR